MSTSYIRTYCLDRINHQNVEVSAAAWDIFQRGNKQERLQVTPETARSMALINGQVISGCPAMRETSLSAK